MKRNQHINFSRQYSKLNNKIFTTVRWLDKFYKVGRVYDVLGGGDYMLRPFLFKARCIKIELKRISQLDVDFIKADADCGIDQFYKMMKRWYSKKPDWKEWQSEMQVLYLKKVI